MTFFVRPSTFMTFPILALSFALSFSSFSHAQNSCAEVMGQTPSEKKIAFEISAKGKIKISAELGKLFIETAAGQLNSTTGNRTEFKRTLQVEKLNQALEKLSKTFALIPRDVIKPGTKNVTVTEYLNVLKFDYEGKELGVKIRLRKYGTIAEGLPNTLENVIINPDMRDVSFLEFKIDHPLFDNSVLKPRGTELDADTALIGSSDYISFFQPISNRAVDRNSKNAEAAKTMADMQNVLLRLHQEGVPLKKDSRTIYERTSYALPVTNPVTGKQYEIQITIDEGIILYSYPHDKTVDAYKSDKPLTVVELKIPVEMVDSETKSFSASILEAIPELKSIQAFLNDLTASQAPGYEANKGKQSLIRGLLESKE